MCFGSCASVYEETKGDSRPVLCSFVLTFFCLCKLNVKDLFLEEKEEVWGVCVSVAKESLAIYVHCSVLLGSQGQQN